MRRFLIALVVLVCCAAQAQYLAHRRDAWRASSSTGSSAPTYQTKSDAAVKTDGTAVTVTLPAYQANDILVAQVLSGSGATIAPDTSGWSNINTQVTASGAFTAAWYWKRATSSETNPSFSNGADSTLLYARVLVFRGCITTGSPFEDVTPLGATNSTIPITATITTTGASRLAVCLTALDDNNANNINPPPTSWTLLGTDDTTASGTDGTLSASAITVAAAGDVSSTNYLTLLLADFWVTLTFALIPP